MIAHMNREAWMAQLEEDSKANELALADLVANLEAISRWLPTSMLSAHIPDHGWARARLWTISPVSLHLGNIENDEFNLRDPAQVTRLALAIAELADSRLDTPLFYHMRYIGFDYDRPRWDDFGRQLIEIIACAALAEPRACRC